MREPHPAENRGYRELHAFARQLSRHWGALAERLPEGEAAAALRDGAQAGGRLLDELGPRIEPYGLYGEPAAQATGARLGGLRVQVRDRLLDRNQALRWAVLDIQHVTTLLLYLAEVADSQADEDLAGFCRRWERSLRRIENTVRRAAAASGEDPGAATEPLDGSPLGRVAHGAAHAMGTFGEWIDRRRAERAPG